MSKLYLICDKILNNDNTINVGDLLMVIKNNYFWLNNKRDIGFIANGDIVDIRSASQALEGSEADGLMMGRGVIGKPWLISQISACVNKEPKPSSPNGLGLIEVIAEHYDEILSFYGESLGVRIARKHLKRYLDIFGLSKKLSTDFLKENSAKEVIRKLFEIPERLNQ